MKKKFDKIFSVIKNKIKALFSQSKNQGQVNSSDLLKVKHYEADSNISNGKRKHENVNSMPLSY